MSFAGAIFQTVKKFLDVRLYTDEFTDPPAAAADNVIASGFATANGAVVTKTAFNGTLGGGPFSPPRNIQFTLSTHADFDAGTAVVTGTDTDGKALTENFAIPDGGNATVVGNKAFKTVTQIDFPAGAGTNGAITVGVGTKMGFTRKARVRAGTVAVVQEIANSAVAVNGTYAVPATGAPNGTYIPNSAADGSKDYAVTYEVDGG